MIDPHSVKLLGLFFLVFYHKQTITVIVALFFRQFDWALKIKEICLSAS